jgi:hypothetical protein
MKQTEILKIRDIFGKEIKPLAEKIDKLQTDFQTTHQTIYGSDGKGGIKKAVEIITDKVSHFEKFETQVKTVAVTIIPLMQVGINGIMMWIKSKFN